VEGPTAATGPAPLNLQLSRERAAAVVEWLAARGGRSGAPDFSGLRARASG
jgi:outer membrane protein OmpA-like peptidoglycan-associated protein